MWLIVLYVLIYVLIFPSFIEGYTISKNAIPLFPTVKLMDDSYLERTFPDGKVINITCPDNTILNKKTLTCDFVTSSVSTIRVCSMLPIDDCRNFKTYNYSTTNVSRPLRIGSAIAKIEMGEFLLCDDKKCTKMHCPSNNLFNVKISACDYPEQVNCCEFDSLNSSRILQN